MGPDLRRSVPLHALVHAKDQGLVGFHARVALSPRLSVAHLAEGLPPEVGDLKRLSFELEALARVGVDAIAALLGLLSGEGAGHQPRVAHQPINAAGSLWVIHDFMPP